MVTDALPYFLILRLRDSFSEGKFFLLKIQYDCITICFHWHYYITTTSLYYFIFFILIFIDHLLHNLMLMHLFRWTSFYLTKCEIFCCRTKLLLIFTTVYFGSWQFVYKYFVVDFFICRIFCPENFLLTFADGG